MRDWLALPLSSSSSSTTQKSITSSDEDEYDIVNRTNTSEEEEGDEELEPAWVTLLNAFVGIDKQQLQEIRQQKQRSMEEEQCVEELEVKKPLNNKIVIKDEAVFLDEHGEITDNEDFMPEEDVQLKRTLSNSSLASSTDTDNSTPASSQIMGPSSSSFEDKMSSVTTTTTRLVEVRWNHGGKKVQVTGEFDNWSGSVDMMIDTEQSHVAMISMDSTKDVEFKFIVDGEWKYAMDLPHRTDWRKLQNNIILVTHYYDIDIPKLGGNVNNVIYKLL